MNIDILISAGMFLTSIAGFSMVGAFGTSIAMAKKQDPRNFAKVSIYNSIIQSSFIFLTHYDDRFHYFSKYCIIL